MAPAQINYDALKIPQHDVHIDRHGTVVVRTMPSYEADLFRRRWHGIDNAKLTVTPSKQPPRVTNYEEEFSRLSQQYETLSSSERQPLFRDVFGASNPFREVFYRAAGVPAPEGEDVDDSDVDEIVPLAPLPNDLNNPDGSGEEVAADQPPADQPPADQPPADQPPEDIDEDLQLEGLDDEQEVDPIVVEALSAIEGLGTERAEDLVRAYHVQSVADVAMLSVEQLRAIKGIGEGTAPKIKASAEKLSAPDEDDSEEVL